MIFFVWYADGQNRKKKNKVRVGINQYITEFEKSDRVSVKSGK